MVQQPSDIDIEDRAAEIIRMTMELSDVHQIETELQRYRREIYLEPPGVLSKH